MTYFYDLFPQKIIAMTTRRPWARQLRRENAYTRFQEAYAIQCMISTSKFSFNSLYIHVFFTQREMVLLSETP